MVQGPRAAATPPTRLVIYSSGDGSLTREASQRRRPSSIQGSVRPSALHYIKLMLFVRRLCRWPAGVGLDFNTELIEAITKTKGCNYFSVHSPGERWQPGSRARRRRCRCTVAQVCCQIHLAGFHTALCSLWEEIIQHP